MKNTKDATSPVSHSLAFYVTTPANASQPRFFSRSIDGLLALMTTPTTCSVELFLQYLVAVPFDEIITAISGEKKTASRRAFYDQRFWWHWYAAWTDASFWEKSGGITSLSPTTPLTPSVQHPLDHITGYYLYRHSLELVLDESRGIITSVIIRPEHANYLDQCVQEYDFLPGLATLLLSALCVLYGSDPEPQSHITSFREFLDSSESLDELLHYLSIPPRLFKKYPAHVLVLAGWVCMELGKYVPHDETKKIYFTYSYTLLHLAYGLYSDDRLCSIIQAGDQVFQLNLNSLFSPSLGDFGFEKYKELQGLMHKYSMCCHVNNDHMLRQLTASILDGIEYQTDSLHDGDRAPSCT